MREAPPISSIEPCESPTGEWKLGPSVLRSFAFVLMLAFVGFLACFGYFMWKRNEKNQCRENLRLINDAVVSYAKDNHGALPKSLELLVPKYLASLPRCPTISFTRYVINLRSNSLDPRVPPPDRYYAEQLDSRGAIHYQVFCHGHCHPDWGVNEPWFDDEFGLGPSDEGV